MDDVSVSNQPHCLTLVFLSACFYVSGDLFGFTLSPQGGMATEQAGTAQRGILLPSRAAFTKNKYIHCEKNKSQAVLYEKRFTE